MSRLEKSAMRWSPRGFRQPTTSIAVVCFADGIYASVVPMLQASFRRHSPRVPLFIFSDTKELGCPSHAEEPYAFKLAAIQTVRAKGFRFVFWCDSVLQLLRPIETMLPAVAAVGVYLPEDGWRCGTFANDNALRAFGVTRDEAMEISSIWACFMGFDFASPVADEFMRRWSKAGEGGLFRGKPWNTDRTESQDPRCRGHRHDQTCAELIAHQMKIPLSPRVLSPDPDCPTRYFMGRELW
jgi:hypothetical protein